MAIEAARLKEEMARESREHALAMEALEADTAMVQAFFQAGKCFVRLTRGEKENGELEAQMAELRVLAERVAALDVQLTGESYRPVMEKALEDADTVLDMCEIYENYLDCLRALELASL